MFLFVKWHGGIIRFWKPQMKTRREKKIKKMQPKQDVQTPFVKLKFDQTFCLKILLSIGNMLAVVLT